MSEEEQPALIPGEEEMGATVDAPSTYDVARLRPPESIADLGKECTGLYHVFGTDMSRRSNLKLIEAERIVYATTVAVVFESTTSGAKEYLMSIDAGGIGCVAVHPSRKLLAIGGRGHQPNIYIYSYPELQVLKVLKGGAEKGYACMNFSADGEKLASVSSSPDFMLTIWDWNAEQMGLHSKAFGQDIFNVHFSEDDPGRLTTSGTGHIRFWKMASTFTGLKLQGSIGKFGKIDLSDIDTFVELPDGKVVSGTETGSLLLWEGNFIKCRLVRKGGGLCHSGVVEYLNLDRKEGCVISAAADGYIRWWSFTAIDTSEVDSDHSMDFEIEPIAELCLGPGVGVRSMVDSFSASGDGKRTLIIQDTLGRMLSYVFGPHETTPDAPVHLCHVVKNMSESEHAFIADFKIDNDSVSNEQHKFVVYKHVFEKFHAGAITGMDTCPVDHLVATCSSDGTVRCTDYAKRKLIGYRKFNSPATCLRWLPAALDSTGKLIAVGFADGIVRIIGLGDNEEEVAGVEPTPVTFLRKMVFKPHNAPVLDISFSMSASTLATSGKDGIIFFFDTRPVDMHSATWRPVRFVTIDPESVKAVEGTTKAPTSCSAISWSPNGASLLASCTDGVLREIDTRTLRAMQAAQHSETDITTFEEFFPIKPAVCNVPVMGASKSTASAILPGSPAKAAQQASSTSAGDPAAAAGGGGGEGSSSSEQKSADATAPAAGAAPESPTKKQASDQDDAASVSLMPAKISLGSYAIGRDPGNFLAAAMLNQKSYFFECNANEESGSPLAELPSGVYTSDGKEQMKNPLPTTLRYGWSKSFLVAGMLDGTVTVRPSQYLETFVRIPAHNSVVKGVSVVAMSYDDRYILSAGHDGTVVTTRLRVEKVADLAEHVFKDIDAGVYGAKLVKDDPRTSKKELPSEPRYLSFVSTLEPSQDENVFSTHLGKRDGAVLDYPLMSAVEERSDIDPKAYSIQDNRLKAEEDAKRVAAEELKTRVRESILALRQDYLNIVAENETIPEVARLTPEQILVDKELFHMLEQEGAEMVEEVHRECEFEAEKAEKLLKKVKRRLMDGLLMEETKLSTFRPLSATGRPRTTHVRSLRVKSLDESVQAIMAEVHAIVRENELKESHQRTTATAQRKANEAMDELMNRIHRKDDDTTAGAGAGAGGNTTTAEKAEAVAAADAAATGGGEGGAQGNGESSPGGGGGGGQDGDLPKGMSTDAMNDFLASESTAAARRQKRKERKEALARLSEQKPNEDEDDIRDLNAITLAEKTTGDYKLKCSEDYEVPEDQRINALKKVRQMAMLEESMVTMRLQFNERFLALRSLKLQIIYAIRRDNKRIREIDATLEQPEKSQDLWEPALDPNEFPDDADEITEPELKSFETARKEQPWEAVAPPQHVVITGTKTQIVKNPRNGTYDAKVNCRDHLLLAHTDKGDPGVPAFLSDSSLVGFTPERTEPRRFYETDEMVLKAHVRGPFKSEAPRLRELESKVPILLRIREAMNQRMHLPKKSQEQEQLNAGTREQLEFERRMILQKMEENLASFAEAVDDLRTDRHKITADLKLAELKLLVLYQEFKLLQTFENRDAALQQKQIKCQNEQAEIQALANENKQRLEGKQEEIQHWNEKLSQITSEFKSLLPDNHPYVETLTKIFKKKIKRNKGREDGDDDDDYSDEDEEDEEDDEEEVEDICPPGCDQLLFERLLDLREKKLDTEEVSAEIQKGIEDLRKAIDRLKQREKQIVKDAKQTDLEVQQFQLQKQAALNQISVVVPLRLGQLHMFETSGSLTGPTDKPASEEGIDPELQESIDKLKDPLQRKLVSGLSLQSHVLFSNRNLVRLKERIHELHDEINDAKEDFKHLHRQRGVLTKDKDSQQREIEFWSGRCRDLQMLKFGREIDLDELEANSDRTKEQEAEVALNEDTEKFKTKSAKLFKETSKLQEELAQVTRRNTTLMQQIADLTEMKAQISKELNTPGQVVTHTSKLDNFKEVEEQKRIAAYVKFQAQELESLRTELNMLKRKEAPPLLSQTQPPPPSSPPLNMSQPQMRARSREDIVLPPIPSAQK